MQHDRAAKVILRHSVLGEDAVVHAQEGGTLIVELVRPAPVRSLLELEWADGSSDSYLVERVMEVSTQDGPATGCVVRPANRRARTEWARVGSEGARENGSSGGGGAHSAGNGANGVSRQSAVSAERASGGDGDASVGAPLSAPEPETVAATESEHPESQAPVGDEPVSEEGGGRNDDDNASPSAGATTGRSRRKGRSRD